MNWRGLTRNEERVISLTRQKTFRWLFLVLLVAVLLSPLVYWSTGVGQAAGGLSAEVGRGPDGRLVTSPKAKALHRLTLPIGKRLRGVGRWTRLLSE